MWLRRLTKLVAVVSFLLIIAGSLVTSVRAYEVHRLLAAATGLLTIVLAAACWRFESRGWVRHLAVIALAVVVIQGLLGAVSLERGLPQGLATTHSGLAAAFFALTVALALVTSSGWLRGYGTVGRGDDRLLRRLGTSLIVLLYLQIMLGALVRHAGAAQAIPDYPLAFGGLVPPVDALAIGPIAVHFAHRLGALVVSGALGAIIWRIAARHRDQRELTGPAMVLGVLLVVEILLGGAAVVAPSNAEGWPIEMVASGLTATGALMLATSVVLALRVHRPFLASGLARG